jgi:predicted RNase H-like HicB family nuclease
MTEYSVIYEPGDNGSWHARAADLPVFAVGDTKEEAESEVRSAIAFYLKYLEDEGEPIPEPRSLVGVVTV